MTTQDVTFECMVKPTAAELMDFYQRQNHPTPSSAEKIERMIDTTFCFAVARKQGELIGFARGLTDGLTGRLAECKLDPSFQGPACVTRTDGRIEHDAEGIARRMAELVIQALGDFGVERIEAVAYGTEVDFCEELGFRRMRGSVALEWNGAGAGCPAPSAEGSAVSARA